MYYSTMSDPISSAAAAELLELSPSRVRALALAGKLKGFRVGRDWVYERADVMKFKSKERRGPGRPKKAESCRRAR
jgi:excisionase family DNA binding protein